jgi:hypothetical protein
MSSANDDDRTVLQPSGSKDGPTLRVGPAGEPEGGAAAAPPPVQSAQSPAASSAGDSGNALPAGKLLGEFELTSVLGEGGFGIVYVAWDRSLLRKVAIKEYMPSSLAARAGSTQVQVRSERHRETFDLGLRSFINEARLLAQFDHPSLVKVYRFWEANGTAYMVMPLYEGITLKDKLRQMGQPPSEDWLMQLLAPLTEALAVIHAENCFHRDIAPDNVILLAGTERPLLLDFGAARRVIGDMTQALTVILKPGYAPVEQYAELPEMKQGGWTDVYALAASVHFAIMGRTPPTSVSRLLEDKFVPLSQSAAGRYSERFLHAMDRALKVRPSERTASIDALRADLGLPPASLEPNPQTVTARAQPAAGAPGNGRRASDPDASNRANKPASAPAASVGARPGAGGVSARDATPAPARRGLVLGGVGVAALAAVGAGYALLGRDSTPAPATEASLAPATDTSPAPPAAATPAAPPSPAPPLAFEIEDQFSRVLAGQTPDFDVQARSLKPVLRVGRDQLGFEISSSRDGFVQVLVLGPDGTLVLMFPNAQASDNRIRAGQTLRLPQANWPLDVTEPAGQEDFLVIVSQQPRDYSELSSERAYIFLKLPTGSAGTQALKGWTRSTPLLLGALRSCPTADCETYGAARFSVQITL